MDEEGGWEKSSSYNEKHEQSWGDMKSFSRKEVHQINQAKAKEPSIITNNEVPFIKQLSCARHDAQYRTCLLQSSKNPSKADA